ncbi:MAG: ssDNA-binding domain-containing protein, partial [Desulfovibrio sp.]|nr:ssDNA-binding domain-containing protein [Desulfovibrio sp.]
MATQKMFVDQFADKVIDALEKGNAPWQREWKAGGIVAPVNAVTGKRYTGVNLVTLMTRQMETGSADPRYVTGKQAQDNGLEVRDGAKGVPIQYWQTVKQGRPLARVTTVFHASEVDGMPPLQAANVERAVRDSLERADKMLRNSKMIIASDQTDRSFYRVSTDTLHIPPREKYADETDYCAGLLRGLVHASGHPDRMNRSAGPKGSEAAAQEKLRTEIASWILAADMGLPFVPAQQNEVARQNEVSLWVEGLKKDPHEIMRVCRDAEKIVAFVKGMENDRELSAEEKAEYTAGSVESAREESVPATAAAASPGREPSAPAAPAVESGQQGIPEEKTWLNVPYTHRYLAKNAGAKWDGDAKLWYAPTGSDLKAFERWMPENALTAGKAALTPQEEFARALHDAGLDLKGRMPLMDGQIHRVTLLDSTSGKLNGSYKGFLDGIPAGYIENWKTGEKSTWKYSGHMLSGEQIHKLRLEAGARREAESKELNARHDRVAKRCYAIWKNCDWANKSQHPYLEQKQVQGFGVKVDAQGNLIVPGRNASGAIRTILTITPELKKFEQGAEVKGTFHLIDPGKNQDSKNSMILIAEGYATAASVHMGTGLPVVCAFNTNNLLPVAKS